MWASPAVGPRGVVRAPAPAQSVRVADIDLDELLDRASTAAGRTVPGAQVRDLRRLEGGVSSLTYAGILRDALGDRPVVLKVAPPGLDPVRNRDVLRQARVLDRLDGLEGFPVPAVIFEDLGAPPEVPPLFGMELSPGEAYEPLLDVSEQPPRSGVAADRMRAAARALARMHAPTPDDLGLAEEPVAGVRDELDRWQRLFATVDADIAVGHEKLYDRLAERIPDSIAPRLLHGDFRLANMLFQGRELEAVIDWEIWSVGDPRADLAWLMMHARPAHVFHEDRSPADIAAGSELPSTEQLVAEYVDERRVAGGTDDELQATADQLGWFLAVCYYKTASTIAVIWKRERKRPDPDPKLIVADRHLEEVLDAGHRVLDGL